MQEEKIFGVGLSRTGTTSLTSALKILDYHSIHYPDYYHDVFLKIHIEDNELKQYQTLTDVPVAYLFKELDTQYPNAKFILTIRDEDSWLNSVSKFFTRINGNRSRGHIMDIMRCLNPKNKRWRSNYLLRHYVYGSFKYNEKKYLKAYRKHNKDVIDYFKGSNGKLLVVNLIDEKDKWSKLCDFLGKDIPLVDFPHKNNANRS